ncbi:RNA polymerase sigma factor [Calycomorphotria hydatis]|uniref:RNA polymerase sigma factor n=2 Tax=Calycomorphotria hydatis TaxID=2528027 RepID=A0A517TDS2_9PLAN|nr:RNA polymerase sigma factor [Calycomorphotria hydatis]
MKNWTTHDHDRDSSDRQLRFVQLLAAAYRRIYSRILTLVSNRDDADELMQDVSALLWEKFDEFEEGTSFPAWACTIATQLSRNFCRRKKHRRTAILSDSVLSQLARTHSGTEELLELRRDQLAYCMRKMSDGDQTLLNRCYRGDHSIRAIASELRQPVESVYVKLGRLRRKLAECIDRKLRREDLS